jgi:16S rRNA (uracil1498-N3)-methyltransferase
VSRAQLARRIEALAQFRVADPTTPELAEDDRHHLLRVLRASEGDEVVVTDGRGTWAFARVIGGTLIREEPVAFDEPDDETTLYLSPLKGDRSEWAVAKATELGVTTIVPLLSARVVVKTSGASFVKSLGKWRRVAAAVAGQCRRTHDLTVADPIGINGVPAGVAAADFFGASPLDGLSAIAIGPEGGWAPDEWDAGRTTVGLGETVLRGDTAALAAATLLVSQRPG